MVRDGRAHDVERLAGGGYLVDGELVSAQPRSSGEMVRDDAGRPIGPLLIRPGGPILSVR